jgi:hypothetical protein
MLSGRLYTAMVGNSRIGESVDEVEMFLGPWGPV